MSRKDTTAGSASQSSDSLISSSQSENKSSRPSDEFEDLIISADVGAAENLFDEPSDEFVDILGGDAAAQREEVDVTGKGEVAGGAADPQTTSAAPLISVGDDLPAVGERQPPVGENISDPLVDLLGDPPAPADAKSPSAAVIDLFEDDGSNIFTGAQPTKPAKPQKSLFGEPDEDLFSEPLGAVSKTPAGKEQKKPAAAAGEPLQGSKPAEPTDIFPTEAVPTMPKTRNTSAVASRTNGVQSEEGTDIFAGRATVSASSTETHKSSSLHQDLNGIILESVTELKRKCFLKQQFRSFLLSCMEHCEELISYLLMMAL